MCLSKEIEISYPNEGTLYIYQIEPFHNLCISNKAEKQSQKRSKSHNN